MLFPFWLRPYAIVTSLFKQVYTVSPPQLVTFRYSVLAPSMLHEPVAVLLTDLWLPGTITDVVLQCTNCLILVWNWLQYFVYPNLNMP